MDDDYLTTLMERICADAEARRDLLWLLAMEKDDADTARSLEEVDPLLGKRMRRLVGRERASLGTARERRRTFGELYDARFAYHERRLMDGGVPPPEEESAPGDH